MLILKEAKVVLIIPLIIDVIIKIINRKSIQLFWVFSKTMDGMCILLISKL